MENSEKKLVDPECYPEDVNPDNWWVVDYNCKQWLLPAGCVLHDTQQTSSLPAELPGKNPRHDDADDNAIVIEDLRPSLGHPSIQEEPRRTSRDSLDQSCEQVAVESTAIVPVGSSRCFEERDQGLDIGEQREKLCTNLKAAVANGCWYALDPMDQTTAEFWFRLIISQYESKDVSDVSSEGTASRSCGTQTSPFDLPFGTTFLQGCVGFIISELLKQSDFDVLQKIYPLFKRAQRVNASIIGPTGQALLLFHDHIYGETAKEPDLSKLKNQLVLFESNIYSGYLKKRFQKRMHDLMKRAEGTKMENLHPEAELLLANKDLPEDVKPTLQLLSVLSNPDSTKAEKIRKCLQTSSAFLETWKVFEEWQIFFEFRAGVPKGRTFKEVRAAFDKMFLAEMDHRDIPYVPATGACEYHFKLMPCLKQVQKDVEAMTAEELTQPGEETLCQGISRTEGAKEGETDGDGTSRSVVPTPQMLMRCLDHMLDHLICQKLQLEEVPAELDINFDELYLPEKNDQYPSVALKFCKDVVKTFINAFSPRSPIWNKIPVAAWLQKQVTEYDAKKKAETAEKIAAQKCQDEGLPSKDAAGASGDQNPKSSEVSRPIRVGGGDRSNYYPQMRHTLQGKGCLRRAHQ